MPLRAIALILLAAALAGVAGYVASSWLHQRPTAGAEVIGTPRLDFELPNLDGNLQRLSAYDGKVILLNFWATWCGPCIEEIPMLGEFQAEFGPRGVQVIGVALDDKDAVTQFIKRTPLNYPTMLGEMATLNIGRIYGNHRGVLPYSVVIDRSGVIRQVHVGLLRREQLEDAMLPLL
jgi:peroxiredoxin